MPKKYSLDALDNVLDALNNAPPPDIEEIATTKQIIEGAFDKIESLAAEGHTFEQISGVLAGVGVEIAPSTLLAYVREIRKERAREAKRRRKLARQQEREAQLPDSSTGNADSNNSSNNNSTNSNSKPLAAPKSKTPLKAAPNVIEGEIVE